MSESTHKYKWLFFIIIAVIAGALFLKKQSAQVMLEKHIGAKDELKPQEVINNFTIASREAFNEYVKTYILDNPEVIIKALEDMQKRKIKEMESKVKLLIKSKKAEIEDTKSLPFVGSNDNAHTIVMFYDYVCGYCKKANTVIKEILMDNKDLRVIYKPLPILGESSEYIAKIALAVYNKYPDKFYNFHNEIMTLEQATRDRLKEIVVSYGMDFFEIESELDKPELLKSLENVKNLALEVKIQGTPAFIIGEELYSGFLDKAKLQSILDNLKMQRNNPVKELDNLEPAPSGSGGLEIPAKEQGRQVSP